MALNIFWSKYADKSFDSIITYCKVTWKSILCNYL